MGGRGGIGEGGDELVKFLGIGEMGAEFCEFGRRHALTKDGGLAVLGFESWASGLVIAFASPIFAITAVGAFLGVG